MQLGPAQHLVAAMLAHMQGLQHRGGAVDLALIRHANPFECMQTEPDDENFAAIEEGQAALRRQLDSQASGLSAADRAASAPTSAGALATAGSAQAEPAAAADGAGAAQRAGSARPPGSRKPPRRKRSKAARQSGEQGAAYISWACTSTGSIMNQSSAYASKSSEACP
jgi:hypothetical protein